MHIINIRFDFVTMTIVFSYYYVIEDRVGFSYQTNVISEYFAILAKVRYL